MFAQFFGNFLLNNKLVSSKQLAEAMEQKKTTRLKLGVLAINAGYMNADQVDQVHQMQQKVDKRMGDIAVEMGYLTEAQVGELLSSQKTAYLLLGQALVDKGYMTNAKFEEAIQEYKSKYQVSDTDLTNEQEESIRKFLSKFYQFNQQENETGIDYVTLLFNNIVRFIGDDFIPLEAVEVNLVPCENLVLQKITGPYSVTTAFEASSGAFAGFASRFAGEDVLPNSEMADAAAGEFLNLHNGLFIVNMSNEKGTELDLTPQDFGKNTIFQTDSKPALKIPLSFSFGTVNFLLTIG